MICCLLTAAWRYRTPQKVLFIEDITDIMLQNFPDYWKLGQSYFTREVRWTFVILLFLQFDVSQCEHFPNYTSSLFPLYTFIHMYTCVCACTYTHMQKLVIMHFKGPTKRMLYWNCITLKDIIFHIRTCTETSDLCIHYKI